MGDKSIMELPPDVLRSIWYYLSLPDVIRFGMTAKNMIDLTWPYYQEIPLLLDWPISALSFVLARDLSHVRSLEIFQQIIIRDDSQSDIELLEQQLESLNLTYLPNLHSLSVNLEFPEHASDTTKKLSCFNEFIYRNTQLQSLTWFVGNKVAEDLNISQFFMAHTRLTRLLSCQNFTGARFLTQLKSWSLSFCNDLDDAMLSDVLTLTQLQHLDIGYPGKVTDESFTKITSMVNLTELRMRRTDGIKPTSLELLKSLPKLVNLTMNFLWDTSDDASVAAVIVGQLTNLNSLMIYGRIGDFDCSYLTNLAELHLDSDTMAVDFSNFFKLTNLYIQNKNFDISTLPPNLEVLDIRCNLKEESVEAICGLSTLRYLQVLEDRLDATELASGISQLTSLNELIVIPRLPKELIPALRQLPNLATLMFSEPPDDDKAIEELAKLTQVMELTYWDGYRKDLKSKLPFNVFFVGEFEENAEEEN